MPNIAEFAKIADFLKIYISNYLVCVIKDVTSRFFFPNILWSTFSWLRLMANYILRIWLFTSFEPILKLFIKLKNCLAYEVISNAHTFLFIKRNSFLFFHCRKCPILPNFVAKKPPLVYNFFSKTLFNLMFFEHSHRKIATHVLAKVVNGNALTIIVNPFAKFLE